jgi:hypothetical protein
MDVDGEPKVEGLPDESDADTELLLEKISIDNNNNIAPPKDNFVQAEDTLKLEQIYKQKNESATFQVTHPDIKSDEGNTEPTHSNSESVESNTVSADNSV